jgi:hypothetical protein
LPLFFANKLNLLSMLPTHRVVYRHAFDLAALVVKFTVYVALRSKPVGCSANPS